MPNTPSDLVVATAGHVDHGKSCLIEALTGTHPDRLPEEQRREMTIELGFASLPRSDGGRLALIDVPGHERLVETMIAGASGIDAALLVVATDDGPMPQTVEHLRILTLLGINQILVALTRIDLVDAEWQALARETIDALLRSHGLDETPIVPVSARTGEGLEPLRLHLHALPSRPRPDASSHPARLPLDRVFQKKGLGTIVAGTLDHGTLRPGLRIWVEPSGVQATIRQVQRHGEPVSTAEAGQRVALNLAGSMLDRVRRGDVLSVQPLALTRRVDVSFQALDGSRTAQPDRGGVRFCCGATSVDATLRFLTPQPPDGASAGIAQIRLAEPIPLLFGDRFIIRRPSPATTLGGGIVLDPAPDPRLRRDPRRLDELAALATGDPSPTLRRRLEQGPVARSTVVDGLPPASHRELQRWLDDGSVLDLSRNEASGKSPGKTAMLLASSSWAEISSRLITQLDAFHTRRPAAAGLATIELQRLFDVQAEPFALLLRRAVQEGAVVLDGPDIRLRGWHPRLPASEWTVAIGPLDQLEATPTGLPASMVPLAAESVAVLERSDELVRLGGDRLFPAAGFETIGSWVVSQIEHGAIVDLTTVRDGFDVSRDVAQLLLERLDGLGVTRRADRVRRLGPNASSWLTGQTDRHHRRRGARAVAVTPVLSGPAAAAALTDPSHHLILTVAGQPGWPLLPDWSALDGRTDRTIMRCDLPEPVFAASFGQSAATSRHLDEVRERINGAAAAGGGLRLYAPVGHVDPDAVLELLEQEEQAGFDRVEVWLYHPFDISDDAPDRLLRQLGRFEVEGLMVTAQVIIDTADNRAAIIDAMMARPDDHNPMLESRNLIARRRTIDHLIVAHRRSSRVGPDQERLWVVERDQRRR